jgi:pilus assembly protein TadC
MSILLKFESLLPRKLSETIQRKLGYGSESKESRKKAGFVISYPLFFGLLTLVLGTVIFPGSGSQTLVLSYLIGVLFGFAGIYVLIDYQSMTRARRIESQLPDALELVAVNISSGLTIENALVESARPEFGELASFLKKAAKEIYAGSTIEMALKEISQKVDSEILQRTTLLLTEGMRKGASLGDLLLRISNDLRNEDALKKEINSNISMYIMLIIIASAIGAPILFGAGTIVAASFAKQSGDVIVNAPTTQVPLLGFISNQGSEKYQFSASDIETLSVVSILLTSLFASLMIGIIRHNKEIAGLRYFPVLLIISLIIFYASSAILKKMVLGA